MKNINTKCDNDGTGHDTTLPNGFRVSTERCRDHYFCERCLERCQLPLKTFISFAHKLNNFLCFVTDQTVSINSVTVLLHDHEWRDEKNNPEAPIDTYFPSLPFSERAPTIQWQDLLFTYGHVADRVQTILKKWLDAYERISPAFNLYFASKSGAHKYIDGHFLSLAQGIETFHRRTSNETVMRGTEFVSIYQALIAACPSKRRKWLEGRLQYSNELSLRTRLKQLLEPFESLFGSGREQNTFIDKIVNTRNYLTHYDNTLESKACKGEQLLELCMKMECLFEFHFLKETGFSEQEINAIAAQNRHIKRKLKSIAGAADQKMKGSQHEKR